MDAVFLEARELLPKSLAAVELTTLCRKCNLVAVIRG